MIDTVLASFRDAAQGNANDATHGDDTHRFQTNNRVLRSGTMDPNGHYIIQNHDRGQNVTQKDNGAHGYEDHHATRIFRHHLRHNRYTFRNASAKSFRNINFNLNISLNLLNQFINTCRHASSHTSIRAQTWAQAQ